MKQPECNEIQLIETKEKNVILPTPTPFEEKQTARSIEKKKENLLPFSLHADIFIPPTHYIIKKETQSFFLNLEKDVIELERHIKKEYIGKFEF